MNENSVYTRSLVPLLQEPGLSIRDLAVTLRRQVSILASSAEHDQRPAYYDGITGDFCLNGCQGQTAPDDEMKFWRDINTSENPAIYFEEYLKRYPNGVYAQTAKSLINALKPKTSTPKKETLGDGEKDKVKPTRYQISIRNGHRVKIKWHPEDAVMTEELLVSRGIKIEKIHDAIVSMYCALAGRDPEDVALHPDESSEGMPSLAYNISPLGVNNKKFDSFDVYQKDDTISISLFKAGELIKKPPYFFRIIDLGAFREALARGLVALYLDEFKVEFGELKVIEDSDNSWHYTIPYSLRPIANGGGPNFVDRLPDWSLQ